ncbi:MAG: KH domain-containing protein [Fimbriimonadaceae bacterium]|nr:KH domain-containing protein [Fimbriimonadaceae bacterium]
METIEVQGKNLAEATRIAAEKFGVDVERVEAEVIEEMKGLFGKGSVRVRAMLKPEPAAKPARGGRAAKAEKPAKIEKIEVPAAVVEPEPEPEPVTTKPARAEKGRGRKDTKSAKPEPKKAAAKAESEDEEAGEVREEVVATQEDAEELADIVNEILDLAQLQASVKPTGLNGRYVNLELDGKDVAYLVGKHGEVLNAFQYLLNIITARQLESGVRVTLDGANYRRRREEALCNLALQIAEQVRERGEEAVLDALPAFERRVVHKAISEFDGVSTYSEGEEPNRRVVIAPSE